MRLRPKPLFPAPGARAMAAMDAAGIAGIGRGHVKFRLRPIAQYAPSRSGFRCKPHPCGSITSCQCMRAAMCVAHRLVGKYAMDTTTLASNNHEQPRHLSRHSSCIAAAQGKTMRWAAGIPLAQRNDERSIRRPRPNTDDSISAVPASVRSHVFEPAWQRYRSSAFDP